MLLNTSENIPLRGKKIKPVFDIALSGSDNESFEFPLFVYIGVTAV
jgi:hypothetical protein